MENLKIKPIVWVLLSLVLLIVFLLDVFLGSVAISIKDLLTAFGGDEESNKTIFNILWNFRIPKALTALIAGIGLSVSGLQMQTIFKNPLAGPYVLGISAGASLGVALLVLGFSTFMAGQLINLGNWLVVLSAWIGAGAILFLILLVSFRVKDIMTILILGIMFGSAVSALVTVLQYFSDESLLKTFIVWTMGSLGGVTKSQLAVLAPGVLIGLLISILSMKMLNALLMGENYATTVGLNIKRSRIIIFISTSLMAGSITAFCGPIGFIGIAVPHIARIVLKSANHNVLLPGSIIFGGIIMLLSDIFSSLPGTDTTLPINSITALLGVPIIIWILVKNRRYSGI